MNSSSLNLTVRVGCRIAYETSVPTPVLFVLRPRLDAQQLVRAETFSRRRRATARSSDSACARSGGPRSGRSFAVAIAAAKRASDACSSTAFVDAARAAVGSPGSDLPSPPPIVVSCRMPLSAARGVHPSLNNVATAVVVVGIVVRIVVSVVVPVAIRPVAVAVVPVVVAMKSSNDGTGAKTVEAAIVESSNDRAGATVKSSSESATVEAAAVDNQNGGIGAGACWNIFAPCQYASI